MRSVTKQDCSLRTDSSSQETTQDFFFGSSHFYSNDFFFAFIELYWNGRPQIPGPQNHKNWGHCKKQNMLSVFDGKAISSSIRLCAYWHKLNVLMC